MSNPDPADKAEGLLKRIEALLSRAPAGDDDDLSAGKAVPYDRFFKVNQRAKAAEDALSAMRAEVQGIRDDHSKAWNDFKTQTAVEVTAVATRYQEDLQLVQAGMDDLGRETLRAHHRRLPEAERAKAPAAWWGGQLEALAAHRADPEKVPAPTLPPALAVYLPPAPSAPSAEPAPAPSAAAGPNVITPQRLSPDGGVLKGKATGTAAIEQAQSIGDLLKAVAAL